MPIISHEPAHESEKKLSERGVNIEEIGPLQIIRRELWHLLSAPISLGSPLLVAAWVLRQGFYHVPYLAKVDLIKDDLIGMPNAPESRNEGQSRYNAQRKLVVPFRADDLGQLGVFHYGFQIAVLDLCRRRWGFLVLLPRSLPDLGGGHGLLVVVKTDSEVPSVS